MSGVNVEVVRDLPFPAARVWELLGDFGNMRWADDPKVELIGSGVGMTRRIMMPGMDPIDEVLESLDHEARTFSYTIPRGMPMPVSDYRAFVSLEETSPTSSRVRWCATATPQGVDAAQANAILTGAYGQLLGWLESWLSSH